MDIYMDNADYGTAICWRATVRCGVAQGFNCSYGALFWRRYGDCDVTCHLNLRTRSTLLLAPLSLHYLLLHIFCHRTRTLLTTRRF